MRRTVVLSLLLVALVFLAYTPAINCGFIWDDDDYVENNLTLRNVDGLAAMWLDPLSLPQYYPLVHTTFWLEYQLTGLAPQTFHMTNIAIHALSGIVLWRLLSYLSLPAAWFAAACFALHPVQVESVAWITERKNVLSGLFYFLAALSFLQFNSIFDDSKERKWKCYGLSLAFFVAALLCKTVTASLPAALLVIQWWKHGRVRLASVVSVLPMVLIAVPFGLFTVWLEKNHVGAKGADWDLSILERCLVAGRACWFYAGKLVFPVNLTFIYPRWEIRASDWSQYLFPVSAVALVVALWALRGRLGRGPLAAVLFFGGTLVPALGFFDVLPHRYSFVADHFQYIASVGILSLLVAAGDRGLRRMGNPKWRGLVSVAVLATLSIATWNQCWIYSNREVLWLDTIGKNPTAEIAFTNLGMLYLEEERYPEALAAFARSYELAPDNAVTNNNLGVALGRVGQAQQAIERFQVAVSLDDRYGDAYNNLGAMLCDQNRLDEAIAAIRAAIRIDDTIADYHYNLGRVLLRQGKTAEAEASFAKADQLSRKRPDTRARPDKF